MTTMIKGLIISDGWNLNIPKSNHLVDPLMLGPRKLDASKNKETKYIINKNLDQMEVSIRENIIKKINPTINEMAWETKRSGVVLDIIKRLIPESPIIGSKKRGSNRIRKFISGRTRKL